MWGFGFATLFWLVVAPAWTFPFELLVEPRNLLLALGVSVIGTLCRSCCWSARCAIFPRARVAVVAMLEPVLGAVIAWGVHDQALAATQIAGGVVVLAAITWVQTHRPSRSLEEWTSSSPEATGRSPVAS